MEPIYENDIYDNDLVVNDDENTKNNLDDMEKMEEILNVFIIYYKKAFPDSNLNNFFDGIVNYDDTNKIMEHFFQCINDYKVSKYKTSLDYDSQNIETLEDKYILTINNENIKMSDNVISLLCDIINSNYNDNWNIVEI
jgi:hypothetical protein